MKRSVYPRDKADFYSYNPPEVYKPESETCVIDVRKCDLWTLGLACWETLANGRPYYEDTGVQEAMSIFNSLGSDSNVSGTTLGSHESGGIESKLKKIYQIGSQLSSIGLKFVDEVLCHELDSRHRRMCLQLFDDLLCEDPKKRSAKSIHLPLFYKYRCVL